MNGPDEQQAAPPGAAAHPQGELLPTEAPGPAPGSGEPPRPDPARRPSTADLLLQRTRSAVRKGVDEAGKKKDMTAIIVVVLLLLGVLGIVALGLVMTSRGEQTVIPHEKPQIELRTDDREDLRSFVRKTLMEVTNLKTLVKENADREAARDKRMDDIEEFVKRSNRETLARFSELSTAKLKELERLGGGRGARGEAIDQRVGSVLSQYVADLISLDLAPEEARKKAAERLRQAGYQEDRIRDALAEAAQQAGRVTLGNVAEPALSAAEIAALAEELRPLLGSVQGLLYSFAMSDGRLYWEQSRMEVGNYLKANVRREQLGLITPQVVQQVGEACRVRRENLSPEQEDLLPYLVAQRDEQRLSKDDRYGIARLVWKSRLRFLVEPIPGQLLSLAQAVGRAIGATTRAKEAEAFKPLDEAGLKYAGEYVATAVGSALAMGRNQSEQWAAAERSFGNYLETARCTATEEQRKRVLQQALATGLRRQQEAAAVAAAAAAEPPKGAREAAARPAQDDTDIYFGPLKIDRARMAEVLILAMPGLLQAAGMDPTTSRGAAALVGAGEQVPRLQLERVAKWGGRPGGGRDCLSEALPELLTAARVGETLGASPLKISNGRDEDSPAAQLLRGVALGAVYGPFVHDEVKAKAAAREALPAMELAAPLTPVAARALAAFPGRPLAAVVSAYDLLRPRRFAMAAGRLQELCDGIAQLQSQAGVLQDSLGDALPADGSFAEQVKLFIPFAVAFHDDGRLGTGELMARVRREVQDHALLFAAEHLSGKEVRDTIIPRHVASLAGDPLRSGQALVGVAALAVPAEVFRLYDSAYRGKAAPQLLASTAREMAAAVVPQVEQLLVREVVLARVVPRISFPPVMR